MAVVKANAYGHGLLPTVAALTQADGFAVARLQEAVQLRDSGVHHRLLLLATLLNSADLALCSTLDIDVVAHKPHLVRAIADQAHRTPLRVWLKHDSGMHRPGLTTPEFIEADRLLSDHAGVRELVHMSHYSSTADRTS